MPCLADITEHLLPRWLAPNLITLTGLFALLVSYVVAALYLPELAGEDPPRWLYFLSGSAVLFYLHMDCLDGKQARRTKNSSPLGQLFDHGGCWWARGCRAGGSAGGGGVGGDGGAPLLLQLLLEPPAAAMSS